VSAEDVIKCEERFNKSKMVHSILRHVAEKTQVPIETLYEQIGWPLMKKYGHAVDAFKYSITYVLSVHSLPLSSSLMILTG
jgi:translation initiation factor 2 subunit 1